MLYIVLLVLSCEHETWCDCKSDSVTSLKAEETKLEEVVHGLQSSVSKMIVVSYIYFYEILD